MSYIWENDNWPDLIWDGERLLPLLARVSHEQGRLLGRMDGLGFDLINEARLRTLTDDVVKSSEIEGENLPQDQVRSSIARRLGIKNIKDLVPSARDVDGIVEMMTDATVAYAQPLTHERLLRWHASLFPEGRSGMSLISAGSYRTVAMQVVSSVFGKDKVHYEAPPPEHLPSEIQKFLEWFENPGPANPLLVAGLAHLWFVTIHPFDDGNGRIARAIADMALARAEQSPQRFYSMSKQIRSERNDYYLMLERTQKGSCDITPWQEWFLACLLRAIESADSTVGAILRKARFWRRFAEESLNERQTKMLNMLLDRFEGKLTSTKWAKIAKCSPDTALRDINGLIERGALQKDAGGGRSTSYSLVADD